MTEGVGIHDPLFKERENPTPYLCLWIENLLIP